MHLFGLKLPNRRKVVLLLFDVACLCAVNVIYLGLLLWTEDYRLSMTFLWNSLIVLASVLVVRFVLRTYSNLWRYTDIMMYLKIVLADVIAGFLALGISFCASQYESLWHFVTVISVNTLLCLSSRFSYRLIYRRRSGREANLRKIPVAIIGAGTEGAVLAEELLHHQKSQYRPVFFIDIDRTKVGNLVAGLRVYYEDDKVLDVIREYGVEELFIALTNVDGETREKLYAFSQKADCKIKMYDATVKDVDDSKPMPANRLRDFSIEDLLFRQPLTVNGKKQLAYYTDKTVLVTGGGGSIGSEICRQLAKCRPAHLIIFDIYENNAYEIQQELLREYGDSLKLTVEIGSVRDRDRLQSVFAAYRPQIVFHAAAHKHVPLMEHSGCEAIKNNIFGTKNVADMAEEYGVQKFILISTDKAVNPTNIMGASKRMCEKVIQCRADSQTTFAAVRFGNVLGSNGSVIPLFKKQIAEGGPVTVTDKRIIRYFMTIPEASQLVMQAGAMARSGELFVLDMGKPVHIYTLAENMIRLSGFRPHEDIEIKEIGLRPGEKLYEELLIKTEKLDKTENEMIFIEKDTPPSREEVDRLLSSLWETVQEVRHEIASESIKEAMKKAVPEFRDPSEINRTAEESDEMKMTASVS